MHLQTAMEVHAYYNPGPSPELLATNKKLAKEVLEALPKDCIVRDGLREAVESWANAPTEKP